MDNLFFLYSADGNPSIQAYTAEELRAKGVQPNDIVCKKYDTPRRALEYPELETLFDWQPEKLSKKDMKAINAGKVRTIVVASLLGITTVTGGYFAVTSNTKSAMTSEKIANLESDKQKLEDNLKQIENYNRNLIVQEQKLNIEIVNIESQKIELEKHRINLTNEIGKINIDLSANKRKYDKAEEIFKSPWSFGDTKKNAAEEMKYYDEAMKVSAKIILDFQKTIAQDSIILVSSTNQYESANKNLDEIQKRKNENERQLKDLRIRGDTLAININQLRASINTNPR
jgi:chromosome segregation ATPase